jgi:hypothetical protein
MRKLIAFTASLALFVPMFLTAQSVGCALSAMDSVAGLGTEIHASGCDANVTIPLTITRGGSTVTTANLTTNTSGEGSVMLDGTKLKRAGSYTVSSMSSQTTFTVLPGAPDFSLSTLESDTMQIDSDGGDSAIVTAHMTDNAGNPLSGRPLALLSSRDDDIRALAKETDEQGSIQWEVRSFENGTSQLSAYDILTAQALRDKITLRSGNGGSNFTAALTGNEQGGEFGELDHFDVTIADGSSSVRANEDVNLRIVARDSQNNIVESYNGTVIVSSTDQDAKLPGRGQVTFRPAELGIKTISLGLTFLSPGQQSLTVEDSENQQASGQASVNVSGGSPQGGDIQIVDPPYGARVNKTTILLQGKAPSLLNLRVKGGMQDVTGESDAEGIFRIEVPLNPTQIDQTLFVVSDNGRYQSNAHRIILDQNGPSISLITFDPVPGKSGDPATITVKSEPGLSSMKAEVGAQVVTLAETQSGTYTAQFAAPAPQNYSVKVTATDSSGNSAQMLAQWTVEAKGLPQVQNLHAESRPNAVLLSWDPIQGVPVAQYRIYVGSDPMNFENTLETGAPVNSAIINGLVPGRPYAFAVTGLNAQGEESKEKSAPIMASSLGMFVKVTPQSESLLLEWAPPADTPLAGYILEYGVDSGVYSEKRMINGELKAYTMRDLLNDVTYELRLTPIAVTGQPMTDLATVVRGTPNGTAFRPSAPDPVPGIDWPTKPMTPDDEPPVVDYPNQIPSSGIPMTAAAAVVAIAVSGGFVLQRKHYQKKLAEKFLQSMDRTYRS